MVSETAISHVLKISFQESKNLCIENPNPTFAYLYINSPRTKFKNLQELIKGNIDVVIISETERGTSITTVQFSLEIYHQPS